MQEHPPPHIRIPSRDPVFLEHPDLVEYLPPVYGVCRLGIGKKSDASLGKATGLYEILFDIIRRRISFNLPGDTSDILITETVHCVDDPVLVGHTIGVRESDDIPLGLSDACISGCVRTLDPALDHGGDREFLNDPEGCILGIIIDDDDLDPGGWVVQPQQGLDAVPDGALPIVYGDDYTDERKPIVFQRITPF
jgi:hypothetical protein